MKLRREIVLIFVTVLIVVAAATDYLWRLDDEIGFFVQTAPVPAFPGCEGFGCETPGGRGGRVIEVTNLNDSGPGSLRAAIGATGPRIVVFRVGGTIELKSTLQVWNPFITIAGQTAPGGGIALKIDPSHNDAPLRIHAHDTVVRYIRSRPGPSDIEAPNLGAIRTSNYSKEVYNVVVDHCSVSWGSDEMVGTWYNTHDITFQWNIIAEGLQDPTNGKYSFGMLLGSQGGGNISIHHNLFAHNSQRNPFIDAGGVADVVNNVLYNTVRHIDLRDTYGTPLVNVVGNYQKSGANTKLWRGHIVNSGSYVASIYVQDNISHWRPDPSAGGEHAGIVRAEDQWEITPNRHPAPHVTTTSAFKAYDQVLAGAGATLPVRDAVDQRIINDVINGTGHLIARPDEVGGWPVIADGTPSRDNDHDGMPDDWEIRQGFDPNNPADGSVDADGDGYTNVEEYLNDTVPAVVPTATATASPAKATPETVIFELPVVISGTINDGKLMIEISGG